MLQVAADRRSKGDADWWRPAEAALYALGFTAPLLVDALKSGARACSPAWPVRLCVTREGAGAAGGKAATDLAPLFDVLRASLSATVRARPAARVLALPPARRC